MTSPTTSSRRPRIVSMSARAREGAREGSMVPKLPGLWRGVRRILRPVRGEWKRHENEEQHQEFGVAEVVLEEAGSEHRNRRGDGGGGQQALTRPIDEPPEAYEQ